MMYLLDLKTNFGSYLQSSIQTYITQNRQPSFQKTLIIPTSKSCLKLLFFSLIFTITAQSYAGPLILSSISGRDILSETTKTINLTDTKKGTVIVFLSTKCPCSRSHEPILNILSKKYVPLGFQFIGLHSNADETLEMASRHFRAAKLSFPVLRDENSEIAEKLKAYKTPHVYIINPKGEVLFQGGVDSHSSVGTLLSADPNTIEAESKKYLEDTSTHHYLREALDAMQTNQPVQNAHVRVLGCIIKRS